MPFIGSNGRRNRKPGPRPIIVDNIYYSGESDSDSENEEIVAKRGQLYLGCDILNSTMLQCTL